MSDWFVMAHLCTIIVPERYINRPVEPVVLSTITDAAERRLL
jgi:hypothetical protein